MNDFYVFLFVGIAVFLMIFLVYLLAKASSNPKESEKTPCQKKEEKETEVTDKP